MYSRQTADLATTRGTRGLPTILAAIVILLIAALLAGAVAVMASRGATVHPATAPFVPVSIQADKAAGNGATLRDEDLTRHVGRAFVPVTIQPDRGASKSTTGASPSVSGPSSYAGAAGRASGTHDRHDALIKRHMRIGH